MVIGWRGSWVLLQALGLAVNLSSETLSYEMLKIAEMLKKGRGGVEWGCNTLSSMSNTRKDLLVHLFSLLSHHLAFIIPVTSLSSSSLLHHNSTLHFVFACLYPSFSDGISHSLVSSLHPHYLSPPSLLLC